MYRPQFQSCVDKCQTCAQACGVCIATALEGEDTQVVGKFVHLAVDCAQICIATAAFMTRGSDMVGTVGTLCKEICAQCADKFTKLRGENWQACAGACHLCAAECQRMLASLAHGTAGQPTGGPYAA